MSRSQYHSCASYSDTCVSGGQLAPVDSTDKKVEAGEARNAEPEALKSINQSNQRANIRLKSSVAVIGMNSKGLELAAKLSSQEHGVIAVDKQQEIVSSILNASLDELPSQLRKQLLKSRLEKRLSATSDVVTAAKCADTTFVISHDVHQSSATMQYRYSDIQVASSLGVALKSKQKYHLIVFYGFDNFASVKDGLIKIIENMSGKKCGEDFGVCAVIEYENTDSSYLTAYIKGFDQSSELVVRRLFKPIASVNTYFDY